MNMKKIYEQPQMDVFHFPEDYCDVIVISGPGRPADTKGNNYEDDSDAPWYRR